MASNSNCYYSINAPIRSPPPTQTLNTNKTWNPNLMRFNQPSCSQSIDIQQPQQHAVAMNYRNEQSPNIQVSNEGRENFPDKNPESGEDESSEDEPNSDIWVYRRPTSLKYYMPDRDNRGIGVIVTNEKFRGGKHRSGVNKDRENIRRMFNTMRLRIFEFNELTSLEMKNELMKVSKYEVNNSDFVLVVAFSTHGDEKDALYGSDGISISLRADIISLFKPLNCKSLEGKPKIFLIQACRGTSEDYIIRNGVYRDALEKEEIVSNESDILIAYACAPNYRAYRTKREGSWFINDLCMNFMHFQDDHDLAKILTITNQSLMLRVDTSDNTDKIAQSSNIHSTLRKDIFLKSHNTVQESVPLQISNLESKPNYSPLHGKKEFESDVINKPFSYDIKGNEHNGLGIIIVNDRCGHTKKGERKGSHEDLKNYKELFYAMKLKTIELTNYEKIKKLVTKIETNLEENKHLGSFFIAISTHGCMEKGNEELFLYDGTTVEVDEIVKLLQTDSLASKPKVLLIQACRGWIEETEKCSKQVKDHSPIATEESDMVVAYACVKGHAAHRDGEKGSWFTMELNNCYQRMKGHGHCFTRILKEVNYQMIYGHGIENGFTTIKQTCEYRSTLQGDLCI